ncbi:beta-lactamase family protein [Chitinophaga dinghuensis]|uniref:Beta-lactamase family protein n=1 Tax=Chitinophaga dinghuensis TaxID=1539050 RepID=A0A327WBM6_9BACT|nr:serine hydrolase [Chitinophaga dinghuensis]RAJ88157.1 beta-lactamase family protein [Chitinophaga dinghuensis]
MQTLHYRPTDNFRESWWRHKKGILEAIFSQAEDYRLQVIYTRIDRNEQQEPLFQDYHFRTGSYFYPASTVKLPAAILAMEKFRDLNIENLNIHTPLYINPIHEVNPGVIQDRSAASGHASIAHYIKKIFLISDNDAYNRLYEFIGQEAFNRRLWENGYKDVQIRHRVGLPLHEEANRQTNAMQFLYQGQNIYEQPPAYSRIVFSPREDRIGKAWYDHRGVLQQGPMDFSIRNRLPLASLHDIMRSIFFPEAVTNQQRYRLTESDYDFLYRCMSQYPGESIDPVYDPRQYHQAYVKFLLYGGNKLANIPADIRIFNKPGWAYGFLTDTAYIVDFGNNIEFLLSATVYVNKDGILGDDQLAFETIGKPFLQALGEMIYKMELERPRKVTPDLSRFQPKV